MIVNILNFYCLTETRGATAVTPNRGETQFKQSKDTSMYFHIFTKGDKLCGFLFASSDGVALLKWGLLLKEKNLLLVEQILSLKVNPTEKGGKADKGRAASSKSVLIHLNVHLSCC